VGREYETWCHGSGCVVLCCWSDESNNHHGDPSMQFMQISMQFMQLSMMHYTQLSMQCKKLSLRHVQASMQEMQLSTQQMQRNCIFISSRMLQ
jgi:hypothetical protein